MPVAGAIFPALVVFELWPSDVVQSSSPEMDYLVV